MFLGLRSLFRVLLVILATVVCVTTSARGAFEVLQTFQRPGSQPLGSLLKLPNGKAYGTASAGGAFGFGSVFRVSATGQVDTLISFTGASGNAPGDGPTAGLVLGSNGAFYGTTAAGGAKGFGVIFKVTEAGVYTKLVDFTGIKGAAKGSVPGPLLAHPDGFLYGTTEAGGASGNGTIFKLSLAGTFTTLAQFTGATSGVRRGAEPVGKLAANGTTLYGVTRRGGAGNLGTIFRITTSALFTDLVDFNGTKRGANPAGGLVLHTDGKFYGTTEFGGSSGFGTLFRLTKATKPVFTTLRSFSDATGSQPVGELVSASGTSLLGCCAAGGTRGFGGIFRFTTASSYSLLKSFEGESGSTVGAVPRAGVALGKDGLFHGVTSAGGPGNLGTVFNISATGVFTAVANLSPIAGWMPSGAPVADATGGWMFPMASGGIGGGGTLLDWNPTSGLTLAASLGGSLGDAPDGALMEKGGSFYGVTSRGAASARGSAFSYTPGIGAVLVSDYSTSAGSLAEGGFVIGADDALYGAAREGGANAKGTLYKVTTAGVQTRVLSFTGTSGLAPGTTPRGPLIFHPSQSFYGVAQAGGSSNTGVIFKLSAAQVYTVLATFGTTGPRSPQGGLVLATDGFLYGTTSRGGTADAGTIFRINPADDSWSVVAEFDGVTAGNPAGELHAAADGSVLGFATSGSAGNGAVFRFHPGGALEILASFTGTSGSTPGSASANDGAGLVFTGGLATSVDGTVYGTASGGGTAGGGVFFRIPPTAPTPVALKSATLATVTFTQDQADPDHDGLVNLVEYAAGTNPSVPDSQLLQPTLAAFENGQSLSLLFPRDPARSDVTITIEASSNLAPPWIPLATSVAGGPFLGIGYCSGETAGGGLKSVLIRDTATTLSAPSRFIRIRVTR